MLQIIRQKTIALITILLLISTANLNAADNRQAKAEQLVELAWAEADRNENEKAERLFFVALKTIQIGETWRELAAFYFKTEQYKKTLKTTQKIQNQYPEEIKYIVEIHDLSIEKLGPEASLGYTRIVPKTPYSELTEEKKQELSSLGIFPQSSKKSSSGISKQINPDGSVTFINVYNPDAVSGPKEEDNPNIGEEIDGIKIYDISTKVIKRSGNYVYVAVKVKIKNNSFDQDVSVLIEALDRSGFQLFSTYVTGLVRHGRTGNLTRQRMIERNLFPKIKEWRVKP